GVAAFGGRRQATVALGAAGSLAGVLALALLARMVAGPAWSYPGLLLSVLAATLALGGSLMAMSWGHWYLTNSGLPKEPLEQMSLLVAGALLLQAVLAALGIALAARATPPNALGVALGANPALWLRVGVGLVFPFGLAVLAYYAASIRGFMSATGLL